MIRFVLDIPMFFLFLRLWQVQKIIKKMHQQAPGVRDLQQDIVLAVEMLLQQDYLLDQADIKQRLVDVITVTFQQVVKLQFEDDRDICVDAMC